MSNCEQCGKASRTAGNLVEMGKDFLGIPKCMHDSVNAQVCVCACVCVHVPVCVCACACVCACTCMYVSE